MEEERKIEGDERWSGGEAGEERRRREEKRREGEERWRRVVCVQCHRFFGHLAEVKDLPSLITGIPSFSKLDKL